MGKDKEEGMDIKWTPGPGPAPLPYSKRAREAMGYSDDVSLTQTKLPALSAVLCTPSLLALYLYDTFTERTMI